MRRLFFFIAFFIISIISCKKGKNDRDINLSTSELRNYLVEISGKHILFGHQDDLAYGIGWNSVYGESDVKRLTGSYPSVFGWEIGNIGNSKNLDGVPFDSIRTYIKRVHQMGGINTISWHASYPVSNHDAWNLTDIEIFSILPGGKYHSLLLEKLNLVAIFLSTLKDDNGIQIPIIFRPWHEMNGNWFWWGSSTCSDEYYRQLFRFTVKYLRNNKGLKNLLIAFSPDNNFNSKEDFLKRYPGDDYVDILGIDDYSDFKQNRLDKIVIRLGIVTDLAKEKEKIAAFTETGSDRLGIPNWYTSNLLQVLNASEKTRCVSYVMVWRNRDTTHYYVPWRNHEQAEDFCTFANDNLIFLLDDLKQ